MFNIKEENNKKTKEWVLRNLIRNNQKKCLWLKENGSNILEKNYTLYDNDKIVAGAIGYIQYNWYFLDLLYVDENYRGQKLGNKLLSRIEEDLKNQLTGIRTETWNFQAKGFYEKNGFIVFGTLEDCPPDTIVYFLQKRWK